MLEAGGWRYSQSLGVGLILVHGSMHKMSGMCVGILEYFYMSAKITSVCGVLIGMPATNMFTKLFLWTCSYLNTALVVACYYSIVIDYLFMYTGVWPVSYCHWNQILYHGNQILIYNIMIILRMLISLHSPSSA